MMRRVLLASESPRRRELLMKTGFTFMSKGSIIDETLDSSLSVYEAVEQVALKKAQVMLERYEDELIVGADTVVYIDGEVLGKPRDEEDAYEMLKKLSGKTHEVITGVAICDGGSVHTFHEVTKVKFYELRDEQLKAYVKTREPYDKAGAYGIQEHGALMVENIEGDYYNIVGLPIAKLYRYLLPIVTDK